ncbi:LamG domain-containing protein [Candidatus Poribacteria bacterium]
MLKKTLLIITVMTILIVNLQFTAEAQAVDETLAMHLTFDEGKGKTAEDHSNFQNDGTLEGAEWVNGRIDKAVSFDGSSYVAVMPGAEVGIGLETTWAMWFKTDVEGQTAALATLHGTLRVNLSGGRLQTNIWTNPGAAVWNTITSAFAPKSGEWYHVAVTWKEESGEGTIYVNGEEEITGPANGVMGFKGGRQLAIGANDQLSYPGTELFTGVIDDFRIYNRALSEAEIMELIAALAVSPKAKLATTWGEVRR